MNKYVMVTFPEIQDFMERERWGECIFCQAIEGHPCPDSAYMVPESLYEQVTGEMGAPIEVIEHLGEVFTIEGEKAVLIGYTETDNYDCIMGFESDKGWTELDEFDTILLDKTFRSYWYIPWDELQESRSE